MEGPGSILGSGSMEVFLSEQTSNEENQETSATISIGGHKIVISLTVTFNR
jgi:hypothetical protein